MNLNLWKYNVSGGAAYLEQEPYYEAVDIIDNYISLIWCERFQTAGEFKLVMDATPEWLRYFQQNEIMITRNDSDRAMIPDRIRLTTSRKNGNRLEISGKSAEGLANRRVITQKGGITNMNAAEAIRYYMKENIGSYWYYNTASYHSTGYFLYRFLNFMQQGNDDPRISKFVSASPYGMNLLRFIEEVCKAGKFGFKAEFNRGKLYYSSYMGYDRTINQSERNMVIFSEDFDNLGDTEYIYDKSNAINHAIVSNSGKEADRIEDERFKDFRQPFGVGSNMREKYVNSAVSPDGRLQVTAYDVLAVMSEKTDFTGEALSDGQFKYRRDYNLGDTVTIKNPYGITGSATVSEVVETVDSVGYKVIPTFTEWRGEE